jgi:hypothetical protein
MYPVAGGRRARKIGNEVNEPSLIFRQPLLPQLARENIEDGGPDLRDVNVKSRPGPNLGHGRHLHKLRRTEGHFFGPDPLNL